MTDLSNAEAGGDGDEGDEAGATAATVYATEPALAAGASMCDGHSMAAVVFDRAGVRDGQPFMLGPDGSYDLELNRFLRELSSWGVR
ncbi:MAG: hypothetical protein ACYDB7_13775, partial [Mycobacteriales bacterium]